MNVFQAAANTSQNHGFSIKISFLQNEISKGTNNFFFF